MSVERFFRAALLEAGAVDLVNRTARLSFSSEEAVLWKNDPTYGTHWEILSHGPGDTNIGFLNRSGVVLFNHEPEFLIGIVVPGSVVVGADRKARATIQIDPEWDHVLDHLLQRIDSGEMQNAVSVGYCRCSVLSRTQDADGIPIIRFSWEPDEISILTSTHQPADWTVGIGRMHRSRSMKKSFDEILEAALSATRSVEENEWSGFSLGEAFNFNHKPQGMVREACEAITKIGDDPITGGSRVIPFAAIAPHRRDMTVGVFGQGGALVVPDVQPIVAILKNRCAAVALGAVAVSGLEGDFALPVQTSSSDSEILDETTVAPQSDIKFIQQIYKPCRVTIQIPVSQQLLCTTAGGRARLELFLRTEMRAQISTKVDRLIFAGTGGGKAAYPEPLGLLNTPGTGSVILGGVSWSGILAFEKSLTDANADVGALGWAISGATRNKWKQTSKGGGYPQFLMEANCSGNSLVNDYPVAVTNNLADFNQSVFGAWDDLYILFWGDGIELCPPNPYTRDIQAEVLYTAHVWFNLVPRHAQSFCVSADSAAI